jgi:hypothetical protein
MLKIIGRGRKPAVREAVPVFYSPGRRNASLDLRCQMSVIRTATPNQGFAGITDAW